MSGLFTAIVIFRTWHGMSAAVGEAGNTSLVRVRMGEMVARSILSPNTEWSSVFQPRKANKQQQQTCSWNMHPQKINHTGRQTKTLCKLQCFLLLKRTDKGDTQTHAHNTEHVKVNHTLWLKITKMNKTMTQTKRNWLQKGVQLLIICSINK